MNKKENQNLKDNAPNVYFCPYCRVVSDNPNVFNGELKNGKWRYKCISRKCGKYFYQETYKLESKNGKHYFTKGNPNDADDLIIKIIIDVYEYVVSYRKVSQLTHFSRSRVESVIKERIRKSKIYSLHSFFEEVLHEEISFEGEGYKKIIVKLLEFGFTRNQIMKNFDFHYYALKEFIHGYEIKEQVRHRIEFLKAFVFRYYYIDKT